MTSHHHCHSSTTSCCCRFSTITHHPPPSDPPLIIHCQSHISSPYTPFNLQTDHHRQQPHQYYYPPQTLNPNQQFREHRRHQQVLEEEILPEEDEINPVISSLLHRIAALESSVRRSSFGTFSLREAAARSIQIHFRAFLVRRSRTLRQLKDLAFIKSALNTLKLSHSNNTRSDSRALSFKALNLLNKLELIQGSDPMIRDGKRSINKELIRFMDYLDELSVKRHQLSSRAVKHLRIGGIGTNSRVFQSGQRVSALDCRGPKVDGERELLEKLRKRVEKMEGYSSVSEDNEENSVQVGDSRRFINGKSGFSQIRNGVLVKKQEGGPAKSKKSVRFAENGNVYMVYKGSNGPVSFVECHRNDGDSADAEEMGREIEDIGTGEDDEEEDHESPQISDDDERDPRMNVVAESDNQLSGLETIENEDGSFVFSAPLPAKMEGRADSTKKTLKIMK